MNRGDLIRNLAERTGLSRAAADRTLDELTAIITEQMQAGNQVVISNFGKFGSRAVAARTGRNPKTGEALKIAARTVPTFSAFSGLKNALNEKPVKSGKAKKK